MNAFINCMRLHSIFCTFFISCFGLLFLSTKLVAQDTATGNSFYNEALLNARAVYYQSFGNQSALYNGSQYGEYLFNFEKGQPFFYSPEPVRGAVIYDGIRYDSVLMRYDEIKDVVVINDYTDRVQLLNEKLEGFSLYQSGFIRLVKDSLSDKLIGTGFYNLLYNGKVQLLKKQIKIIREKATSNAELLRFVDVFDHYFIKKEGQFFPVESKKNLFAILADKKKEVQQFVRTNNLSFRKDPENMLIKTTAFYDSLNK
jgi:hypothetical protein